MPTITLKGLPPGLHRELKNRARANHRSLNKELIATLQGTTGVAPAANLAAMTRDARGARSKFKRPLRAQEISAWKRKGRL